MNYALLFLLATQAMLLVIIALITRTHIAEAREHHREVMEHRYTKLELAVARGIIGRLQEHSRIQSM